VGAARAPAAAHDPAAVEHVAAAGAGEGGDVAEHANTFWRTIMNIRWVRKVLAVAALASLTVLCSACQTPQEQFASANAAVDSLVACLRTDNRQQLREILGPASKDLVQSGDPVEDANRIHTFLKAYDEKHAFMVNDDGSMTLVVGNTDWPLPIPVVRDRTSEKWFFDTAAGKEEMINRRIGRNELYTMQVCRAIADAQREYAMEDANGDGVPAYAQKFISDRGKKNGLYWVSKDGDPASPLGPLVAEAEEHGYVAAKAGTAEPRPFHGYLYRILKSQGPNAKGGARDYVVNGQMIGGFAVVAYPASYGSSGVTSFIINQDGDLYERDLGPDTAKIASAMTAFDPDSSWRRVENDEASKP
jgi:hypothetical protein